ncbi:hypothetical protein HU200_067563 [Digitaria exilis]|uniref:ACT domain-containing protein ACR n=1 Tax=Digitaria exilis TaxID=1010633 RepID=A0A834ZVZ9_9POAL|nr:hypothetical protein HU200_067563 [Digitaria exilis]
MCSSPLSNPMKALKDLGLDVTKGTVTTDLAVTQTKFHIMRLLILILQLMWLLRMTDQKEADRPGLLLEIIKIIADTNIDVESAEIDTEVLINCLRYYLRRLETDEDSY